MHIFSTNHATHKTVHSFPHFEPKFSAHYGIINIQRLPRCIWKYNLLLETRLSPSFQKLDLFMNEKLRERVVVVVMHISGRGRHALSY